MKKWSVDSSLAEAATVCVSRTLGTREWTRHDPAADQRDKRRRGRQRSRDLACELGSRKGRMHFCCVLPHEAVNSVSKLAVATVSWVAGSWRLTGDAPGVRRGLWAVAQSTIGAVSRVWGGAIARLTLGGIRNAQTSGTLHAYLAKAAIGESRRESPDGHAAGG